MSRLTQIKEKYQIKKLTDFKEQKAVIMSIRMNQLQRNEKSYDLWIERTLDWITNISIIMDEIKYEEMSLSKLFDIIFLAELAQERNIKKLKDYLDSIPHFRFNKDSFECHEITLKNVEYLYMTCSYCIENMRSYASIVDRVNGFEFLTRYIKDKEVFEIYYMNEIYHINTIEDYLRIKETLEINKMEGEGSLVLADMISID